MPRRVGLRRAGGLLPLKWVLAATVVPLWIAAGCPTAPLPDTPTDGAPVFNNTSDPTNGDASYVGSAVCAACHNDIGERTRVHAHTQALKRTEGVAPDYPRQGVRAGVPDPPDGKTWDDVGYVIGGYTLAALFVDADGFVMTDGVEAVNTQWNLDFSPNGAIAGFVSYRPDQQTPLPYEYGCFRCHTTGPQPQNPDHPGSQDGRVGVRGTWVETGVQCEACHGPGSRHVPNPQARDLFVDSTPQTCARCHTSGDDPAVIHATDGFINTNEQYAELLGSGGHAGFVCTICHEPHTSAIYDRSNGIRSECTACHSDMNMARHEGRVFSRGGYVEDLTCESCHMPFAVKSAMAATEQIVGGVGRMGDVRSHIFRIDTRGVNSEAMFSSDGRRVVKDTLGRAAVTVDFVCLRCHTDESAIDNNAFPLSLDFASEIAEQIHRETP